MATMTPAQAAATLLSVEGYAEQLTNRTIGLTNMVWAVAAASIFLTYGTAPRAIEGTGMEWVYSILWIPGVLGGTILTAALWHSHAVTLHLPNDPRRGAIQVALHVGAFLILAGALFYGLSFTTLAWNTHTIMTLANGLFAVALGFNLKNESRLCSRASIVAGGAMIAGAIAIVLSGLSEGASALAGASTVFTGWLGAGIVSYVKG